MANTSRKLLLNDLSPYFGLEIRRHAESMTIFCEAATTSQEFLKAISTGAFDLICIKMLHSEVEGLWALFQLSDRKFEGKVIMFNESLPVYSRVARGVAQMSNIHIRISCWPIPKEEIVQLLEDATHIGSACLRPGTVNGPEG